ncbi:hol-like chemotaxis [Streptomyces phage SF1]|uniref:Uncharacterized protein n=2 Tax=Caudoviricetes TaxID=2731619 RepID=A0A0K1Y5A5_9CAUD|nr:hypothetical protein [Streptomyces sp. SPB78]YP_009199292.1 hol-like chemotaxis [Streptomyces phage SF1]YP_009213151.1 hol-like chemotaxis [Streptomyces phage SF3]AKY02193.1 hypothetical protein SF1_440 [Streptomyces phage SF1]ALF00155.1 hypothetical protein SF3_240 [Streptomyces phage SF3]EFL00570.1 predicted protein [Streptomyces sp. SPB78]
MDVATLGAVGTILVGLATAVGALVGKRGENRAAQSGAVIGGYGALVDNLQEERDKAQAKLAENEQRLAEAYRELSAAHTDNAEKRAEITILRAENERLRARITELGGAPT